MDTFILILTTGIGLGALYFLVACGLTLIYGIMGVLNFAHGTFLTVGAFCGVWAATHLFDGTTTLGYFLSLLVGGLGGGLFALLMEQLVIVRLYERHMDQALVTVGVALFVGAILSGWFSNDLRLLPSPPWFTDTFELGKSYLPKDRFVYFGVSISLLILLLALLKFTRIGLIIRAGVENRNMVSALGINVRLAFSTVFFLGGLAAGISGVLIGTYQGGVSPLMGGSYLIYGFIVVVIGGMGSLPGTALSALIIGVLRQFVNYYAPGLGDFVIILILAGVLLFRPQGLLGKVSS